MRISLMTTSGTSLSIAARSVVRSPQEATTSTSSAGGEHLLDPFANDVAVVGEDDADRHAAEHISPARLATAMQADTRWGVVFASLLGRGHRS